jgi:LuxR family transcriptional regulator, maltose regulon positive regulatory protein
MDISVSRIKVTLPRRRNDLLSRARLNDLIDDLLEHKLILLTAPAGYGKTSLVIEAAHRFELAFCWYNLDELDRNLNRFIVHIIAAIDQRFPGFEKACNEVMQAAFQNNLSADHLARLLANEVYQYVREHVVFVLDNYHLVDSNPTINAFTNRFIQEMDENFHLVIISRSLLPLQDLPLMVARSQVGGLGFQELSFTPDEIQSLMQQNYNQNIPDTMAVEMAERTEGWITGLLLSAQTTWQGMTDRERVSRVTGVALYDYLIHQILDQQPPELRDFLLRTSLFDEFDAKLCEAVLGPPPGETAWQAMIRKVIQNNLFVLPIDEERRWLRYHHLFKDFLRTRLAEEQPEEEKKILRSLANVFIERKDWERAYAVLQQLKDIEATVALLELAGEPMVKAHQLTRLAEWLDALPNGVLESKPTLLARRGIVAATLGETLWGLRLLNQAVKTLRKEGDPARLAGTLAWRALVHYIQANHTDSLADVSEMLSLAEQHDIPPHFQAEAYRIRGLNERLMGNLNDASQVMTKALELFRKLGDTSSISRMLLDLGAIYIDTGDLALAIECYQSAMSQYREENNNFALSGVLNDIGFLHFLRGEYAQADQAFAEALQRSRTCSNRRVEALVLTGLGDLYVDLDAFQAADDAYKQAFEVTQRLNDQFLLVYLGAARAGLARIQNDSRRAQRFLDYVRQLVERSESKYVQAIYKLEEGRLALLEKDADRSVNLLEQAAGIFDEIGQRVETSRTFLNLALAHHEAGDEKLAQETIARAYALVHELGNLHLLVPIGHRAKSWIESLQDHPDLGEQTTTLLQAIQQFEQNIPQLRQHLRRPKTTLPTKVAAPSLQIQALGTARVTLNKKTLTPADWQVYKTRDLFFLLVSSDRGWSKEAIGEMLWPDSTPAQLKLRFKNTIYRLRRVLGTDVILFDGERYSFNRKLDYFYDVEAFGDCLARAEKTTDIREQATIYREAIQLYKGRFLPEVYGSWVTVEREHLHRAYIDISLKLAANNLEIGEYNFALTICNDLILANPILEEAYRVAMRAYAAQGNQAGIMEQYHALRMHLESEMGLPPSTQTERLYQQLIH